MWLPVNNLRAVMVVLLALPLVLASCKDEDKTAAERPDLHEKRPESPPMKWEKTFESNSLADSVGRMTELTEYDREGNKVRIVAYDTVAGKVSETRLTYNDKGQVVKSEIEYADGSTTNEVNTYNSEGMLTETKWKASNGPGGRHVYAYDEHDKLIRWEWYQDGALQKTRVYPLEYDEEGHMTYEGYGELRGDEDTVYMDEKRYFYDSLGRKIGMIQYETATPLHAESYIYDSLDNLVTEVHRDRDSSGTRLTASTRILRSYNKYGELVQMQQFMDNTLQYTSVYVYDEYGQLLQVVTTFGNGTVRRERKEYGYFEEKKK